MDALDWIFYIIYICASAWYRYGVLYCIIYNSNSSFIPLDVSKTMQLQLWMNIKASVATFIHTDSHTHTHTHAVFWLVWRAWTISNFCRIRYLVLTRSTSCEPIRSVYYKRSTFITDRPLTKPLKGLKLNMISLFIMAAELKEINIADILYWMIDLPKKQHILTSHIHCSMQNTFNQKCSARMSSYWVM